MNRPVRKSVGQTNSVCANLKKMTFSTFSFFKTIKTEYNMEENKTLKIISICGFIVFATVSCWATAESLHLLLPNLPLLVCWAVTVGFFVIASWGSKMIVDSLNQNIYLEKRGIRLIGGIIIVLFFWLICSMPTNTHTFFYRGC